MDPWNQIFLKRYEEALNEYSVRIAASVSSEYLDVVGRATARLCLGRLAEAYEDFQLANELASKAIHGEDQPYLQKLGVILWLMGRRSEAIDVFMSAVDGILNGSIKFADLAGGASEGLLLWYAGVTAQDDAATDYAVKYLGKLAKTSRIQYWPGPLVSFVLGEKTFDEVLKKHWGTPDVGQLMDQAREDLLKRRELVQALFCLATSKRNAGCENECLSIMIQCSSLENPILEEEWYLAQAEATQALSQGSGQGNIDEGK